MWYCFCHQALTVLFLRVIQEQLQGAQWPQQPLQEEAMQAYVSRFRDTGVAVFSPITPSLPPWVDDVIPTFVEWIRWLGNRPTDKIAHVLNKEELRGELGFMYMIIDIGMDRFRELMSMLKGHVQLVGYRELVQLAYQKREYERTTDQTSRTAFRHDEPVQS